ncbi:MAG TPA: hypothetical protein VK249_32640 [Anaerolineales bacterium]|nr:hypothetical protein [Anaerolineales bacterium]
MQTLGRFFAALCAISFIISGVLVLLLFNIERKAFSSETYKQAFENQGLYQRMPAILGTALTTFVTENQNVLPFLKVVTVQDWQNIISTALPPEELKAVADNALDSTFDYLNGKTNSATISLLPLKAHLAGESGVNIVIQILSLQPACTPEQLTQMALGILGGQITLCNPPAEAIGLMTPFIQSQLQTMITLFPNDVTFISDARAGTPADPRLKLNTLRSVIKLSLFLPFLFLFGMTIFAVRTLTSWLNWWGWPLMLTGGSSVLIALLGSPLVGWILRLLIQNQGIFSIPPVLAASLAETASAVAQQMLAPVLVEGFILGFVGLGMVLIATFLPRGGRDQII